MNKSIRDKIRVALKDNELTLNQICLRTKIDSQTVSKSLSSMKLRTKELQYNKKIGDSAGTYSIIKEKKILVINDIKLKLSQLENAREIMRLKGVSLIDEIIDDYVLIYENS